MQFMHCSEKRAGLLPYTALDHNVTDIHTFHLANETTTKIESTFLASASDRCSDYDPTNALPRTLANISDIQMSRIVHGSCEKKTHIDEWKENENRAHVRAVRTHRNEKKNIISRQANRAIKIVWLCSCGCLHTTSNN